MIKGYTQVITDEAGYISWQTMQHYNNASHLVKEKYPQRYSRKKLSPMLVNNHDLKAKIITSHGIAFVVLLSSNGDKASILAFSRSALARPFKSLMLVFCV